METYEDLDSIKALVTSTIAPINPTLADLASVSWSRSTTNLGRVKATYNRITGDLFNPRIEFSSKLWPHASPEVRRATIIHECCHLLTPGHHHDRIWKLKMVELGASPNIYHTILYPHLTPSRPHMAACACGPHPVSARQGYLLNRGISLSCPYCKHPLTLQSMQLQAARRSRSRT